MTRCMTCGQELPRFAAVCPVCRHLRQSVRMYLIAAVFLVLPAGLLVWKGLNPRQIDESAPTTSPAVEGAARIVSLRTECSVVPLAVDASTFEELAKIDSAKFGLGYLKLKRESRVFEVQGNTSARILLEEKTRVRVAVSDSATSERVGYVRPEWVFPIGGEWSPSMRQ